MVIDMSKPENRIAREIVDAAVEVHRGLGGPGLLESVYEEALAWELTDRGLKVIRQASVPIEYKGKRIGEPLRLDLLVERKVIVECKATTSYNRVFEAQTQTYLRLSNLKLGLVINFGNELIKGNVKRVVNNL